MPDLENPDDPRDTARLKAVLVLCAATAFVAAPLITQPFTGFDPAQFPNPTPPLPLQPAGYAFSIWGLIYAWLAVSAGFGLFRRDTDAGWDATRWPLVISLAVGASWLAVAQASPVLATALIFVMLAGAVIALLRAPRRDPWWLAVPLGLYAGWLTAASFVAASTTLVGWTGLGAMAASWIGLLCIGALGIAVLRLRPAPAYGFALIWALTGVIVSVAGTGAGTVAGTGAGAGGPNVVFAGGILGAILAVAWTTWQQVRAA